MAIGSAVLAADQLESFLTGGQDWGRCLERYRRAWTAEFAGRIRLGSLAQAILVRPGTGGLLLRWGRAFPFAVDWVIRGTRGRIP